MNVYGLFSDHNRTAPFAEQGDGIAVTVAVLCVVYAGVHLSIIPPSAGYSIIFALGLVGIFGGWKARLQAGDVLDPLAPWTLKPLKRETGAPISPDEAPNWFNARPRSVVRYREERPILPFISVVIGPLGFYAGWKLYGVDSPEYLDYWGVLADDVYPGSQALCKSIRFSTTRST